MLTFLKMRNGVPRFPRVRRVSLLWNPDRKQVEIFLSDAEGHYVHDPDLLLNGNESSHDPIEIATWLLRLANGNQVPSRQVDSSDDEA